ncbi:Wzz/FepE/Etk N-terminal domain-containing protein [Metasolibacillus sp.]|uniref:Wzz/FepE/Etk N-terminal domain-containing protein n=1 Tax=Metasolibacillus sp. TaxID=2703680 RepID=UPI0025D1FE32|nr:Wzz/FepE/Etk N-terminal domain-containing protein [Metasolibacillus sp.]MCT6923390.1 Wzz/FepE/Etk N-terminal domain-containing protein [Metasolibacillus sp.]MCT6939887.1 Wzz/FepE/Etk N-terminal domain-containing protein [Metasolibacillus sp.]
MEETIELRQLFNIIWKGKAIIAVSTIICILFAGILSWFVLEEKYESKAMIQVVSGIQDTGAMANYIAAEFKPNIYAERIQNKSLMQQAFADANIKNEFLLENLVTKVEMDSLNNNVELRYTSNNAQSAQLELQVLIEATKNLMNEAIQKSLKDVEALYTNEMSNLSVELEEVVKSYNAIISNNNLPEVLILQTVVDTNNGIILNASEQQKSALSDINGELQNQLLQLQTEIRAKSDEYKNVLINYQSIKTNLNNFKSDSFIRVITEPTLADDPLAPSKVLNLVLGLVIGLMLGLGIVFLRAYWKNSAPVN